MNVNHNNSTLCKIYTAKILNDFSKNRDISRTVYEFYSKVLPYNVLNEETLGQAIIANINSTIEEIKNRYRRLVGKDPQTTNVANTYTMFTKHVQEKLNAAIPNMFKQAENLAKTSTKTAETGEGKPTQPSEITNAPPKTSSSDQSTNVTNQQNQQEEKLEKDYKTLTGFIRDSKSKEDLKRWIGWVESEVVKGLQDWIDRNNKREELTDLITYKEQDVLNYEKYKKYLDDIYRKGSKKDLENELIQIAKDIDFVEWLNFDDIHAKEQEIFNNAIKKKYNEFGVEKSPSLGDFAFIPSETTIYQKRSFRSFYESKNVENLISQSAIQIVQNPENLQKILNEFIEKTFNYKIVLTEAENKFQFGRPALFGPESTQQKELTNFGTKIVVNLKNLIDAKMKIIPEDKKEFYQKLLDNLVKLVIKQLNTDFKSTIKEFEAKSIKKPDDESQDSDYKKTLSANLSKNITTILKTLGYNSDRVLEQIQKAFDKGNKKLLDNYKNELTKKLDADPRMKHNKNIIVQFFDDYQKKLDEKLKAAPQEDKDLEVIPEKKRGFWSWFKGKE